VLDQSTSSQGPDDERGDGQGDADPDRSHHLVHEVGDLKHIQSAGEKQNFIFQSFNSCYMLNYILSMS
jgi:hypothetical protein